MSYLSNIKDVDCMKNKVINLYKISNSFFYPTFTN